MFTCHKSISIYCICLRVSTLRTSVANIFMTIFTSEFNARNMSKNMAHAEWQADHMRGATSTGE